MFSLTRPSKIPFRHRLARSAVAIIYRHHNEQWELLLIKRAIREGDPWSGHMAFPGGKVDPNDLSTSDAAIRETLEEVGIDLHQCAHFQKRLSDLLTRRHNVLRPMVVSPFLFQMTQTVTFKTNHEVEEVVWIPLDFFLNKSNQRQHIWKFGPFNFKLPSYVYEDRVIWGLTYQMIQEVLRQKLN